MSNGGNTGNVLAARKFESPDKARHRILKLLNVCLGMNLCLTDSKEKDLFDELHQFTSHVAENSGDGNATYDLIQNDSDRDMRLILKRGNEYVCDDDLNMTQDVKKAMKFSANSGCWAKPDRTKYLDKWFDSLAETKKIPKDILTNYYEVEFFPDCGMKMNWPKKEETNE
jgi:hypothetical protein